MIFQRLFLTTLISMLSFTLTAQTVAPVKNIYNTIKKINDWQIHQLETKTWKYPASDQTNGALYTGMMAWAKMANDEK